jgi:hypothetical protein
MKALRRKRGNREYYSSGNDNGGGRERGKRMALFLRALYLHRS